LQQYEEAKEAVEMFLQYNDNTVERGLFYQAVNAVLEMQLDEDLELEDYEANFRRMFGNERMDAAIGSVEGSVRFHGLTPTSIKLEGLDRAPAPDRQLQKAARRTGQQLEGSPYARHNPRLIRETFPVGPLQCNCTIIGGSPRRPSWSIRMATMS
jgi:hypothetical protein